MQPVFLRELLKHKCFKVSLQKVDIQAIEIVVGITSYPGTSEREWQLLKSMLSS